MDKEEFAEYLTERIKNGDAQIVMHLLDEDGVRTVSDGDTAPATDEDFTRLNNLPEW